MLVITQASFYGSGLNLSEMGLVNSCQSNFKVQTTRDPFFVVCVLFLMVLF